MKSNHNVLLIVAVLATQCLAAERPMVITLQNKAVRCRIDPAGGGIVEFRFKDNSVNPLNWRSTPEEDPEQKKDGIVLQGHFLCLDRWGAPSAAEQKQGVPFHGEAPRVMWSTKSHAANRRHLRVSMECVLPLAQLSCKREVYFGGGKGSGSVMRILETVTNTGKLGRILNIVQHPSIAPPFLDESTLVDSNADLGFLQMDDGSIPSSKKKAYAWPNIVIKNKKHDLRRFRNDVPSGHDVSSFRFKKKQRNGWVTACNPKQGILLGYVWTTKDYPWLNIWRYIADGKVQARGLEFGTTGLHQPFEVLLKRRRALKRPLYEYLDAGQRQQKQYYMFLAKVPADFKGVGKLTTTPDRFTLTERNSTRQVVVKLSEIEVQG